METALEIAKLALMGLIAGLFSSYISNRNHKHLKWWELRVSAYQDAIEALSDLIHYYGTNYDAEIEYREISEEAQEKLRIYSKDAYPKIRKLADCGAFLFSDKANAALKEFMKPEHADMYVEHLEQNYEKAKKCLATLIECSKSDLTLTSSWLNR